MLVCLSRFAFSVKSALRQGGDYDWGKVEFVALSFVFGLRFKKDIMSVGEGTILSLMDSRG